ncbi:hypothetical protein Q0Z83_076590 [Actinoplanes sichuanensis]|uniref:Lipoprotein n=1 Tax=Actinoplanes sichuanensis TaxID=512349 RepID=A0ABW4AE14_9ACTN|nr:hypothetical protein [Actinoplanes sichuanensis]BEL09468.1 hypothetical protein Q0Z83_076590 [Actinoplanes sichuanensis]
MKVRHVLGAVALAALSGCSSPAPAETAAPAAPEAIAVSPGAPRACSDVFVPDKPVVGFNAETGCTNKDGTLQFIGVIDCADGTKLWPVDAATGAPAGYAREDTAYKVVTGEVAADKGYKQAYEECVGPDADAVSPAPSASAE